ncbi:hypothetical protein BYT27DRAFT_7179735, partial [Phlegmacium glaucopus]
RNPTKTTSAVPSSCERRGPEPSGAYTLAMGERCFCRRGRDEQHLSSKNGNGKGPKEPYLGIARILESGGGGIHAALRHRTCQ